jgi:hypothetical protein
MVSSIINSKEAYEEISNFRKHLLKKYNVDVVFTLVTDKPGIPLLYLENIADNIITNKLKYHTKLLNVRSKTRLPEVTETRFCMYYLAMQLGYCNKDLTSFFITSHCNISHAIKTVSNFLDTRDTRIYTILKTFYHELYSRHNIKHPSESDIDRLFSRSSVLPVVPIPEKIV